jgi:hypothetical protein
MKGGNEAQLEEIDGGIGIALTNRCSSRLGGRLDRKVQSRIHKGRD